MKQFSIIEEKYDVKYRIAFKSYRALEGVEVWIMLGETYYLNSGKKYKNNFTSASEAAKAIEELNEDFNNGRQ